MPTGDTRLIEDYLPLDALNAISAREKKHPKHPVALIHYWPARRPTTASRAAIYATLVPAPSNEKERKEAAAFVTKLAAFKPDPKIVKEASERIKAHHGGRAPKILDIFAGGGAIPLEAARLGCESYALEYNPVAYLIELCTVVYPQQFGTSLARDVEHWGKVVLERVSKEVADLYPNVQLPETEVVAKQFELFGGHDSHMDRQVKPVAYIWARSVPCRRPGCTAQVSLVRQAWLRKKGGVVASVPSVVRGNRKLVWKIFAGRTAQEVGAQAGQTGAGQAVCTACSTPIPTAYVKQMAVAGRMEESLAAMVVEGKRSKLYLPPNAGLPPADQHLLAERLRLLINELGFEPPEESLQGKLRDQLPSYGVEKYHELFTHRQLVVLLSLVKHIRIAHEELLEGGMIEDRARAVVTYFGMAFGRFLNSFTKFCRWQNRDQITIAAIGDRQALKMVYDFSEINPFAKTAGCLPFAIENEVFSIQQLAKVNNVTTVTRGNAESLFYEDETFDAVVTDPPYYSSIYYADLSAFFYVWLKRTLGDLYPEHFTLLAPPKKREAVAQPSEHGGDAEKADSHYRMIMERSLQEARRVLKPNAPLVCVYAHKTTEGWATLIRALVGAGLTVTEAWPVQTEARGRTNALESAALSDSIFFVARRREDVKTGQYETDVRPQLERIAKERVKTLWAGGKGIGGADLLMAAVGAGLRAYTRFGRVEYANGEPVPAEEYLREVEGVVLEVMLDEIFGFSSAGVGYVDPLTRFYVLWRFTYRQSSIEAGDAYVFCYPQGIEIDGPTGIVGPPPALVEKDKSKYRVRTFEERGDDETLGISENTDSVALVDILHRLLWLIENQPFKVQSYLKDSRPNLEQLRLVTQALCAPVLDRHEARDATLTAELRALSKLTANWRGIVEGPALAEDTKDEANGQLKLY